MHVAKVNTDPEDAEEATVTEECEGVGSGERSCRPCNLVVVWSVVVVGGGGEERPRLHLEDAEVWQRPGEFIDVIIDPLEVDEPSGRVGVR